MIIIIIMIIIMWNSVDDTELALSALYLNYIELKCIH